MIYNKANMTIIDNIQVDGREDGTGGTHTMDKIGIMHEAGTRNNTINNTMTRYTLEE